MNDPSNETFEKEESSGSPVVVAAQSVFLTLVMAVGAIANSFICRCILARSFVAHQHEFVYIQLGCYGLLAVCAMHAIRVSVGYHRNVGLRPGYVRTYRVLTFRPLHHVYTDAGSGRGRSLPSDLPPFEILYTYNAEEKPIK